MDQLIGNDTKRDLEQNNIPSKKMVGRAQTFLEIPNEPR